MTKLYALCLASCSSQLIESKKKQMPSAPLKSAWNWKSKFCQFQSAGRQALIPKPEKMRAVFAAVFKQIYAKSYQLKTVKQSRTCQPECQCGKLLLFISSSMLRYACFTYQFHQHFESSRSVTYFSVKYDENIRVIYRNTASCTLVLMLSSDFPADMSLS